MTCVCGERKSARVTFCWWLHQTAFRGFGATNSCRWRHRFIPTVVRFPNGEQMILVLLWSTQTQQEVPLILQNIHNLWKAPPAGREATTHLLLHEQRRLASDQLTCSFSSRSSWSLICDKPSPHPSSLVSDHQSAAGVPWQPSTCRWTEVAYWRHPQNVSDTEPPAISSCRDVVRVWSGSVKNCPNATLHRPVGVGITRPLPPAWFTVNICALFSPVPRVFLLQTVRLG